MSDLIEEFVKYIEQDDDVNGGAILEFGTGSGRSTARIASATQRAIHTFDGFAGLPKTEKGVPTGTGWEEGALFFDEQVTRELLKPFKHVSVYKCMTCDLKEPIEYGIREISGVNIDVDLYEGSIDALRFADKCVWDVLIVRFDDWGYYEGIQVKEEVEAHEQAAFWDFLKETGYSIATSEEINARSGNRQAVYKIMRNG